MSSRLQELIAKINQSKFSAAQPPIRTTPTTTENSVLLNPERRAENLRLLRAFLNASQEALTESLRLSSQSYYSCVERGEKAMTAGEARRIEKDLDLPDGWLERNNADSLFLSQTELDLILELRRSSAEATASLIAAVRSIRLVRK